MVPVYPYLSYEMQCETIPVAFPPQHQEGQPGMEYKMDPRPISEDPYRAGPRLMGKKAVITGGDSGIGRAAAYLFAREGADVVISYLCEDTDALETKRKIEEMGRSCLLVPGDLKEEETARMVVERAVEKYGKIDILVNNNGVQFVQGSIEEISAEQLDMTFRTNVYSFFYMVKAALPHMKAGSSIINTASVTAYEGSPELIDYSAAKGAIVAFTRSLSRSLVKRKIRVNAVAPGPVWTPLIPASYPAREVETFGTKTSRVPMMRAGQPFEIAPCYLFLASDDSSYMTGQVLHPNGGVITGS